MNFLDQKMAYLEAVFLIKVLSFLMVTPIIEESVLSPNQKHWSSFLCLLALSSVTCTKMLFHYPKGNNAISYFLNREILPRTYTDVNFGKAIIFFAQGVAIFKHIHKSLLFEIIFSLFLSMQRAKHFHYQFQNQHPNFLETNLNFIYNRSQQQTCAPVKEEILKETKRKHNLDGNSDEFATPAKNLVLFLKV